MRWRLILAQASLWLLWLIMGLAFITPLVWHVSVDFALAELCSLGFAVGTVWGTFSYRKALRSGGQGRR